jgi:hypothetical protein
LLVAAVIALVERDLLVWVDEVGDDASLQLRGTTRRFAEQRPFYRAMLAGSSVLRTYLGTPQAATISELPSMFSGGSG